MIKENVLEYFQLDGNCGEPVKKMLLIATFLQDPHLVIRFFPERMILKSWFHILTCNNCRINIPQDIKERFSELMLYPEEKNLWKLPYYLMAKNLLSDNYIDCYKKKHGEDAYFFYKSLLDEKDIEIIDTQRWTSPRLKYWIPIIINDWNMISTQEKGFCISLYDGIKTKIEFFQLKTAGQADVGNVPSHIPIDSAFADGEKVALKVKTNPITNLLEIDLLGGSAHVRSLLYITIAYLNGKSQRFRGSQTIGNTITLNQDKSNILRIEFIYKFLFDISAEHQPDLDKGNFSFSLQKSFEKNEVKISETAKIEVLKEAEEWLIKDERNEEEYLLKQSEKIIKVFQE